MPQRALCATKRHAARRNRIASVLVVQSDAKRFLDEKSRPSLGATIGTPKYVVLLRCNARVLGISEVDHE